MWAQGVVSDVEYWCKLKELVDIGIIATKGKWWLAWYFFIEIVVFSFLSSSFAILSLFIVTFFLIHHSQIFFAFDQCLIFSYFTVISIFFHGSWIYLYFGLSSSWFFLLIVDHDYKILFLWFIIMIFYQFFWKKSSKMLKKSKKFWVEDFCGFRE